MSDDRSHLSFALNRTPDRAISADRRSLHGIALFDETKAQAVWNKVNQRLDNAMT